ncbi:MAG: response regulator transcription factor [Planctomycetaceae bacterium]|nr:response regulator transcription factor [Planctomycetaceae bacterium]
MSAIRLLLAHELALPRAALRLLLESDSGVTVVAEADQAEQLQEQLRVHHPDLILMAISQRAGLGTSLIETLRRQGVKSRVIAVSPRDEMSFVRLLIAAGAAGYVCERSPVSELRAALREVAQGRTFIDSSIVDRADPESLSKMKNAAAGLKSSGFLSKRETEVLQMLAQGFTNQQVADALSLSVKTAETYRVRLTRKLGVKSRVELFRYAFEVGMIGPDQLS